MAHIIQVIEVVTLDQEAYREVPMDELQNAIIALSTTCVSLRSTIPATKTPIRRIPLPIVKPAPEERSKTRHRPDPVKN